MLIGALLLIGLACLLRAWYLLRQRTVARAEWTGRALPVDAETVSQDLTPVSVPSLHLFDPDTGLCGTIDHLLRRRDGRLLVSEVKATTHLPRAPYENHVLQMGVYFLLCARDPQIAQEPSTGSLQYQTPDHRLRAFEIANTPALRERVLAALQELRAVDGHHPDAVSRSHDQPARCRGCGWASQCEARLA